MELEDFKKFADFAGIEGKNLDELKKSFADKYTTMDQVMADPEKLKAINGKTFGKVTTRTLNVAKAHNIEFPKAEVEGKDIEDIVNMALTKQKDSYEARVKELQELADKGGDEKVKEWQSKFEKVQSKLTDTNDLLKNVTAEKEAKEAQFQTEIKSTKLNYAVGQIWSNVNFAPGTDPLKIKGFKADFNERYKADLDENGSLYVMTTEGKRIPNPNKHSEFLNPNELLNLEIDKAGLSPKNANAGKPAPSFVKPPEAKTEPAAAVTRKIHTRAQV